MAEHEDWTEADDALVRRAMATLRTDVEAAPLADARFVRARGTHRRRRQQLVTGAAAAAAAVVVAGVAGYAVLGADPTPAPLPPAHPSTAQAPTTTLSTTESSLDNPGALPLVSEWTSALGLQGTARLTHVKPFGPVECLASEPGTKVQQEQITLEPSFEGGQVRFAVGPGQDPQTAADGIASDIAGCQAGPGYAVTPETAGGWPRFYSFTAGDAGSGWWAVVPGPHDVAVLHLNQNDRATSSITHPQVARLADIAEKRLARYGTSVTSTTTPATAPTGPKAIDEAMPVAGPDPKPSSKLFVAASQWESTALTGGKRTSAGPGALEGSTAIASCETDEQQAGIGGSVGIVSVRTGSGPASYIGRQRVQLDQSGEPALQKDYVSARLREAQALFVKGCTFPNGTVRSTKGPTQGTFRLDTVSKDGRTLLTEWVGVTAQKTPGAVTTIVVTKVADPSKALAELDRLLALARQK